MNRLLALALCVPFAVSSLALAQPEKKPAAAPSAQPKKEEKKLEAHKDEAKKDDKHAAHEMPADEAGEKHKWLAAMEGEWQASTVEYGEDGKPGNPEKGTMKAKMEFGGRFIHSDFNGRAHGKFFHGEGFTGYSNANKRFEACWVDTMGTSILFMTGQTDAAGKVLTMTGDMTMPDGSKCGMKGVTTIVNKGTIKDEFFMVMGGKDTKVMEITYTKGGESKADKKEDRKEDKKDEKKSDKK